MPEQHYATGKSEQEFLTLGRSGFYSVPHKLYFFDGEVPPPLPNPGITAAVATAVPVADKPADTTAAEVKPAVKKEPKHG